MRTDFDISSNQITYLIIPEKHGQRIRPYYVLLVGWGHGVLPSWFGKRTVRGFHDHLPGPAYQSISSRLITGHLTLVFCRF